MGDQLASGAEALRLFFTDDLFLVKEEEIVYETAAVNPVKVMPAADIVTVAGRPAEEAVNEKTAHLATATNLPLVDAAVEIAGEPEIGKVTSMLNIIDHINGGEAVPPVPAGLNKAVAAPVTVPPVFKYLGKNQKNVLILVNDQQNETSTERGRELLRNIVKALQLTASDFALLNYAGYEHTPLTALTAFFKSRLVLSFGVGASQLGLAIQGVNTLVNEEGVQLIFSQNLDPLADSQADKKALWGSLKQIKL
jgi:DNA polymerase III psi subunit